MKTQTLIKTFPIPELGEKPNTLLQSRIIELWQYPPNGFVWRDMKSMNPYYRLAQNPGWQCRLLRTLEWVRANYPRSTINRNRTCTTYTMRSTFSNAICNGEPYIECSGYVAEAQMQVALYMAGFDIRPTEKGRVFTNISLKAVYLLRKHKNQIPDWCGRPCA